MKRATAILLLFVLIASVFTAGCNKRPAEGQEPIRSEQTDKTDTAIPTTAAEGDELFYVFSQQATLFFDNYPGIIELDDIILYKTKAKMLFTDKEYKCWMPLCSRPDCMHNTLNCNAYFEGDDPSIWVYGRHIYYAFHHSGENGFQLWRMRLDGSAHEKIADLTIPELSNAEGSTSIDLSFHYHYVFLHALYASAGDASGVKHHYLYFDLADADKGLREYEITIDGSIRFGFPRKIFYSEGDIMYCPDFYEGNTVYKIDFASKTGETFCTLPFEQENSKSAVKVGNKLYFAQCAFETKIVSMDLETGETEIINSDDTNTELWLLPYGDYIFGAPGNAVMGVEGYEHLPQGTVVYDLNGERIQFLPLESYGGIYIFPAFCAGHYVFGCEFVMESNPRLEDYLYNHGPLWYLDLNDVGTDNLMWRKWEPEG